MLCSNNILTECAVPEKIHTHPKEGNQRKISKIFLEQYNLIVPAFFVKEPTYNLFEVVLSF